MLQWLAVFDVLASTYIFDGLAFCVGGQLLNLFCASGWELCSTEVELFVLIESSYSVDFALQFGKAWNRSFVGREFFVIHLFLLETVVSVCCEEESSKKTIRAFVKPTV